MACGWRQRIPSVLFLLTPIAFQALPGPAGADEWGPPTPEHRSANGDFILRVDWKQQTLTLKQKRPNGFSLCWSIPCPQENAPVEAYITDDGQHVVLRDEWHHVGRGKVLVFLAPRGRVLRSYELEDILTQDEILDATQTMSSLWWSEDGLFLFHNDQRQFAFVTQKGTIRAFDLASGQKLELTPILKQRVKAEAIARARQLLTSKGPGEREAGATIAGALGDLESRPAIERLLDDPTWGGTIHSDSLPGPCDSYSVQLTAGRALVALLGSEAAPVLERKLSTDNAYMLHEWLDLIGQTGAAHQSPAVEKLAESPDKWTRWYARRAILESDDGTVLRRHPEWFTDRDPRVRYHAIRWLAGNAVPEDEPVLRKALADSDPINALWAMRGLVRLEPPDLDDILHRFADDAGWPYSEDAVIALARRGDTDALRKLVKWLDGDELGLIEYREACEVLAEKRPAGLEEALRRAGKREKAPTVQAAVFGALAKMGDEAALPRLRMLASEGEALDRAYAIKWLGICGDTESLATLRGWLADEEPWIREAAAEALGAMGVEVPEPPAAQPEVPAPPEGQQTEVAAPSFVRFGMPVVGLLVAAGVVHWVRRRRRGPSSQGSGR